MTNKRSKMTGANDVANTLKMLPRGMGPALNQASRKSLQPQLRAAKRNLKANGNVESGDLNRSLGILRDPKSSASRPVHYVGARRSYPGWSKAHLVEFGTSPHFISSSGGWEHPGAAPHPFLTPAFTHYWRETLNIFGREIGPAIEARAAKLAVRNKKK
ncbi:MAG TPA: hypothetical protein VGN79_14365 [Devosia sp.]|jgi:hypothetical protein|nr:hypothetical protein [Devosia sp.]